MAWELYTGVEPSPQVLIDVLRLGMAMRQQSDEWPHTPLIKSQDYLGGVVGGPENPYERDLETLTQIASGLFDGVVGRFVSLRPVEEAGPITRLYNLLPPDLPEIWHPKETDPPVPISSVRGKITRVVPEHGHLYMTGGCTERIAHQVQVIRPRGREKGRLQTAVDFRDYPGQARGFLYSEKFYCADDDPS